MNLVALNIDTIPLGQPLPFVLRGASGVLLAQRGYVIRNRDELNLMVARGLSLDGHSCLTAADGAEALDILLAEEGRFDLLLTDIRMPLMDGIALALAAKQRFPELTIMLMTGYAEQRERAKSLEAIVAEVMSKPFTIAELRATVMKVIERSIG